MRTNNATGKNGVEVRNFHIDYRKLVHIGIYYSVGNKGRWFNYDIIFQFE